MNFYPLTSFVDTPVMHSFIIELYPTGFEMKTHVNPFSDNGNHFKMLITFLPSATLFPLCCSPSTRVYFRESSSSSADMSWHDECLSTFWLTQRLIEVKGTYVISTQTKPINTASSRLLFFAFLLLPLGYFGCPLTDRWRRQRLPSSCFTNFAGPSPRPRGFPPPSGVSISFSQPLSLCRLLFFHWYTSFRGTTLVATHRRPIQIRHQNPLFSIETLWNENPPTPQSIPDLFDELSVR